MTTKKDSTDAWFPFWIGAYLGDTMGLARDLHGGYLLLMIAYWRKRGPLADDDESLMGILRATPDEMPRLRERLLGAFFEHEAGMWRHGRIDKELADAAERKTAAVAKAIAGAAARWPKNRNAPRNASTSASSMQQASPEHRPTPLPITLLPTVESKVEGGHDAPPPPQAAPSPPPPSVPAAPEPAEQVKKKRQRKKLQEPATWIPDPSAAVQAATLGADAKPLWMVPNWVPKAEWAAYVEMRRGIIGFPFTAYAHDRIVEKLSQMRSSGIDIGIVLTESVATNSRDVVPPGTRRVVLNGGSDFFTRFWAVYPRRVAKDAAMRAFAKRKPDEELLLSMLKAIVTQGLAEKFNGPEAQFVPHPATWLNEGRWLDEVQTSVAGRGGMSKSAQALTTLEGMKR